MQKTTVYLDDEDVECLKRLAETTGRSQSELIREGIRRVVQEVPGRTFHSMGTGRSGPRGAGEDVTLMSRSWNAGELYERSFRDRDGRSLRSPNGTEMAKVPDEKQLR